MGSFMIIQLLNFSMKNFQFVVIVIITLSQSFIHSQNQDYSLNVNIKIEIEEEDDNKYSFTYTDKTIVTQIVEKPKSEKIFYIPELFYNKTDKINIKSKSLFYGTKDIPFFIPQSEDVFISGGKVYYFGVPNSIKYGDSFNYEFEQEFVDVAFLPVIWLENGVKYESVSIIIEHPEEIKPKFFVDNIFQEYDFEVKEIDSDETHFAIKNINSEEELKYFAIDDKLLFISIDLQKDGKSINNTSPNEFVNWYAGLTPLQPQLEPNDKNILAYEIKQCQTQLEKLKVIYDYVRLNFRYIAEEQGINSIVPRRPSTILNRGYGDCKDKAALLTAIAKEHNINVNMALVTHNNSVPGEFMYVHKFNHVICYYTDAEQSLFFDPTAKFCEFGNLPESDIDNDALILDSINPRLIRVESPIQNPSVEITIIASIDSLKKSKAELRLYNDYFRLTKHALDELTGIELENFLSAVVLSGLYKISLDYFVMESEEYNNITFSAEADLSDFIIDSKSKKYLPKVPFLYLDRDVIERKKDSLSLNLPEKNSIKLKIILDADEYLTQNDSLQLSDEGKNIIFNSKIMEEESGKKNITYSLIKNLKNYDNIQKQNFLEFYEKLLLSKPNMFILKGK